MRILITGGFGFLGTHLVEELLATTPEADIHIVDNLSTNAVHSQDFLDEIGNPKNVTYSITNLGDYLQNPLTSFDQIYHLASVVGPAGVLPHAGYISQSIVNDAAAIAQWAMRWGARLVDVSTSEIYGGGASKETDPKIVTAQVSPRLEYAVGKLAAEVSLINLAAKGLDVVIVRPFNIAGTRQNPEGGFVLPRFCEAALANKALTVFGSGRQVRAFTHVADMARGLRLAMERGKAGEAYNIGNEDNAATIAQLATKVLVANGGGGAIEHIDPTDVYGQFYVEAKDKLPNSAKARKQLGWKPNFNLDKIIIETLDWTRKRLEVEQ